MKSITTGKAMIVPARAKLPINADIIELMYETKKRFKSDSRRAIYELIAFGANAVVHLEQNRRDLKKLLNDKFFADMHVKPKEASRAVMQFVLDANSKNQRNQANRYAAAIDNLLAKGKNADEIANTLSQKGGVSAHISTKRLEGMGVDLPKSDENGRHSLEDHSTERSTSDDQENPDSDEDEENENNSDGEDVNGRSLLKNQGGNQSGRNYEARDLHAKWSDAQRDKFFKTNGVKIVRMRVSGTYGSFKMVEVLSVENADD